MLGNDFFMPEETHILLSEFTKLTGINCITNTKRGIYVILTKQQIDIQFVVYKQDWEKCNENI